MRHSAINLDVDACTSCMICARECPAWCITIDAHHEAVPDCDARRPRTVAVLDEFAIDWGLCMYCGMCIESCPFPRRDGRASLGRVSSYSCGHSAGRSGP